MAATIANIAKGRMNEFARRVNAGDPADARFIIMALQDTGLDTLDELRDFNTFAEVLAGSNTECDAVGYSRIVLDSTDVADPTVDDTENEQTFDIDDQDFGAIASGQNIQAAILGYTDQAAPEDSEITVVHITRADAGVATNGETFHYRTPNGLWAASEPA